MSLESIKQGQDGSSYQQLSVASAQQGFLETLGMTVSPVESTPSFTSVQGLLSHYGLKEGKILGEGGFGTVKVLSKGDNTYALKQPIPPEVKTNEKPKLSTNELNGFLFNHPQITKTFAGIVKNTGTKKFELHTSQSKLIEKPMDYTLQGTVCEHVQGKDLLTFLNSLDDDLSSNEIYDIATQISAGVAEFNTTHVFCDLKLENIMREEKTGLIKLIDLGDSKPLKKGNKIKQTLTTLSPGTQGYRAPEVCFGHEYDQSADAWSLGATLLDFVCGKTRNCSKSLGIAIMQAA